MLAQLVSEGGEISSERLSNTATEVAGREIVTDVAWTARMLDPWAFVEVRTLPGGPAPAETTRAIEAGRAQLAADIAWIDETEAKIAVAIEERKARIAEIVASQMA